MSRFLRISAIVVVILAVALGVADRVAVHYAEKIVTERVAAGLAARNVSSGPPEVTIVGYPFLTQVVRGNYDEIQVDLRDVKVGTLPIPLLEVWAYDVRASLAELRQGTGKVIATKVDGVGTLSYTSLVEASGLRDITMSGDGEVLRISGQVPIAGVITGGAKVTVVQGQVRIQVSELKAANANPATQLVLDQLASRLGEVTFSLPEMPFRLQLTGVKPELGGLHIAMTANEVELTS